MAKNYGEQSRGPEDEQKAPEQPIRPEEKIDYDEEIKKENERYEKIAADTEKEVGKFAKSLGLSSAEEFADRYEYLNERMQLEIKHKKGKGDVKPEDLFSDNDALIYKYGKRLTESGEQVTKTHEEYIESLNRRKELGQVSEKDARKNEMLRDLGEGITMEAHPGERSGERFSIYKDGKHIGDIIADNNLGFMSDREFQDKASRLVMKSSGEYERKEEKPRVEININSDAKKLMNKMNMVLSGDQLTLQNAPQGELNLLDLYGDGDNQKIDLIKIDDARVLLRVTEKTGRIVEYTINGGVFDAGSRKVKLGR